MPYVKNQCKIEIIKYSLHIFNNYQYFFYA